MPKRPPKKWMKSCTTKVGKNPEVDNPGAVCGNTWYNVMSEKDRQKILKKEKKP